MVKATELYASASEIAFSFAVAHLQTLDLSLSNWSATGIQISRRGIPFGLENGVALKVTRQL